MKSERHDGQEPTSDELEKELSPVEDDTLAEELERKRRGLTQEPVAVREKKKEPWEIEPIHSAYPPEYADVDEEGKSDGDIIERYEKEGWQLIKSSDRRSGIDIGAEEGKEIKMIGRGDHMLVFERPKAEEEKDEEDEE